MKYIKDFFAYSFLMNKITLAILIISLLIHPILFLVLLGITAVVYTIVYFTHEDGFFIYGFSEDAYKGKHLINRPLRVAVNGNGKYLIQLKCGFFGTWTHVRFGNGWWYATEDNAINRVEEYIDYYKHKDQTKKNAKIIKEVASTK